MKKLLVSILIVLLFVAVGCQKEPENHIPEADLVSQDKHVAYIKDYVGRNCGNFGYTAISGSRMDKIGDSYIRLVLVTYDGHAIDLEDIEDLKQYVVVQQNIPAHTAVNFQFSVDSEGNEQKYSDWCSVDEIVLWVKKVNDKNKFKGKITQLTLPEDNTCYYMYDFTNRNLSMFGYVSIGQDFRTYFYNCNLKLNLISEDGSYIDINSKEDMKSYYVIGQSIPANTAITVEYSKDSKGNYYKYPDYQSVEEVDLYVRKVGQ